MSFSFDRWHVRGPHDEGEVPEPCRCLACRTEEARVHADLVDDLARDRRDDP